MSGPHLSTEDQARIAEVAEFALHGDARMLVDRLDEPSWEVRRAVVAALGLLGETAVPALIAALSLGRDSETRIAAAMAALVASTAAVDAELVRLGRTASATLLCDVIQILGRRRSVASAPAVASWVRHEDDNVSVCAIEALGRMGGRTGIEALIAAAQSERPFRVFPALDVLSRSTDPAALQPLQRLVTDPVWGAEAQRALRRRAQLERAAPSDNSGYTEGQELELLAHLVQERTGLHFPERNLETLLLKVSPHAEHCGYASLLEFYYALRYDDPSSSLMNDLTDVIITGETYFFRELPGLVQVVEQVAERARQGRSSRIWSAACATGEEPLSLAVLLAQAGLLDQVEIVATDISLRQIGRARRGEYTRRALRSCPGGSPPWLRAEDGTPVVDPQIRDPIEWRIVNLINAEEIAALGTFDAILCRNVFIYFEDPTISRTSRLLAAALAPDGILLIGASESLARLDTPLRCIERGDTFVYVGAT